MVVKLVEHKDGAKHYAVSRPEFNDEFLSGPIISYSVILLQKTDDIMYDKQHAFLQIRETLESPCYRIKGYQNALQLQSQLCSLCRPSSVSYDKHNGLLSAVLFHYESAIKFILKLHF